MTRIGYTDHVGTAVPGLAAARRYRSPREGVVSAAQGVVPKGPVAQ